MLRLVPGFYVDESIWVREGETRAITGMEGYFIENRDFILETHDNTPQGEQVKQGVNVVAKTSRPILHYTSNLKMHYQVIRKI